ncbi:MAG: hypothetical protein HUJ29_01865 [Gammaproteobacteria bacterium]|nr:hypothetical protein [Gammaproteobacteria bacterium]
MQFEANAIIGTHLGRPIYKSVQRDGVDYVFDRIAECDDDGWYHLTQLQRNEMLLKNGLIYRQPQAA